MSGGANAVVVRVGVCSDGRALEAPPFRVLVASPCWDAARGFQRIAGIMSGAHLMREQFELAVMVLVTCSIRTPEDRLRACAN